MRLWPDFKAGKCGSCEALRGEVARLKGELERERSKLPLATQAIDKYVAKVINGIK